MRIALVSPYSWTYPGGVTRHIAALADEFVAAGHEVRVLAPYDPADRFATLTHRGAVPEALPAPAYLTPIGRTVGFAANGSVSNLSIGPRAQARLARELRSGDFDVIHIHEPVAPLVGWIASLVPDVPLVGTYHSYSVKALPNHIATAFGARAMMNHLHARIAVSEAAAWTGRRWFGGRYRVIPNGVHVNPTALSARVEALPVEDCTAAGCPAGSGEGPIFEAARPLNLLFIGQAVARKGLPMLLRAFEAVREHVPAELTVLGPSPDELEPLMLDGTGVRILGKVSDAVKQSELAAADVLVAPSLGGESFGMVLTEAMAAGTTIVASDIAGYRDVVTDGVDGLLVPAGDAHALAETLRELYYDPARRGRLARAAADTVARFAWERVAAEVLDVYAQARAVAAPDSALGQFAVRIGALPADGLASVRPRRLASLDPPAPGVRTGRRWVAPLRRGVVALAALAAVWLAYLAVQQIGISHITSSLINSSPIDVVLGLVVMCTAMMMRAVSWQAILTAALPDVKVRLADSTQGTMIGVLMSSTLPARLGEPARALVVARRTGRPREHLPIVLGTIVSQTLMNLLALLILAAIMFSSVNFFSGHESALLFVAVAPALLLLAVIAAPALLRYARQTGRFARLRRALESGYGAMARVRVGLAVYRHPRLGIQATFFQLLAWALQALSCYLLLAALGLDTRTGFAGAAAVLFAVNVTAVLPATPANLGVFQAACATVLHTGWHIGFGTGVAYGVILQAVEVVTAILLGTPALLKEGMSWREVRLRAMHTSPVTLAPRVVGSPYAAAPRAVERI
ncbi:lysylphosphatidylglycerol synthase domain-containing protein [Conexibacter sp. DBS9H8]|uniref:lysylphosphatidylglycerol synthase domain-containing protein n=1 Tax=Conexibacter sp. DBS9H8 TaxID=2937801 RepID=UPI00200FA836|nr:lysylphosphatidylglycerol synthase domain-containing protein [Conexibacter sp. DBS9H8]